MLARSKDRLLSVGKLVGGEKGRMQLGLVQIRTSAAVRLESSAFRSFTIGRDAFTAQDTNDIQGFRRGKCTLCFGLRTTQWKRRLA